MIELKINNKPVKIYKDTELTISTVNPNFKDREDFTFPFTIPLTPNRLAVGYPDKHTENDLDKEYPARVSVLGFDLISGNTVNEGVEGGDLDLYVATEKSGFWSSLRVDPKPLNSFDYGSETVTGMAARLADAVTDNDRPYIAIDVKAYDENNVKKWWANEWDYTEQDTFNTEICHNCLPFMRLGWVIRKVFEIHGYEFIGSDKFDELDNYFLINIHKYDISDKEIVYKNHIPSMDTFTFLEDMERRFNMRFLVNDASKMVRVVHGERPSGIICVNALDVISKKVNVKTQEDKKTEIKQCVYKDAPVSDLKMSGHLGLTYEHKPTLTLDEKKELGIDAKYWEENTETIELKSSAIAVLGQSPPVGGGRWARCYIHIELDCFDESQVRLAKWHGVQDFTNMSVTVKSPKATMMQWVWYEGLFVRGTFSDFHRNKIEPWRLSNIETKIHLPAKITDVLSWTKFYANTVNVQGQHYLITDQEIIVNNNGIASHVLTGIPDVL